MSEMLKGFVWEKVAGAPVTVTVSHTNPLNISKT